MYQLSLFYQWQLLGKLPTSENKQTHYSNCEIKVELKKKKKKKKQEGHDGPVLLIWVAVKSKAIVL